MVAGLPTGEPDTDRQVVGVFSDLGNRSDDFVTGNNGILGIAPFIVNDADVAMADATGVDIDFYLLGFQFSRIIGERFEFSLGFRCGIGVYYDWSPYIRALFLDRFYRFM